MAEVGALRVTLALDDANFSRSISDINRKLKMVDSEFKATASSSSIFGNSLETLRLKQDKLTKQFELQKLKVEELRRQYEESRRVKGETAKETENLLIRYNKAVAELNKLERELTSVSNELKQQTSAWTRLGTSLTQASEKLKNIGDRMQSIGRDLSMKITAPIVGIGTSIVKTGMDFEAAMSKVQALSGASAAELKKLEEQAKQLGRTTVFSASQAADAQAFLAMAGWKTNQILAAMPGLLDLAAAGALDLGRAADITSNIMQSFAIEAEQAGRVADVFAYASANANINLEQLGESMKYLAPMANTLGISLEEATAAVMALGDAGIQGSLAGQAFATSLVRLANPTDKMVELMQKLNISFFDAKGRIKPLPDIIAELEKATANMDEKTKAATISVLFGAEAMKHWAVLLETGSEKLKQNTIALQNSEGAARKMAETMMKNTRGSLVEFQSALEGLSIQLSEYLLPHVNQGLNKLTELVRRFGELPPETQKSILALGGLAAALPPVILLGGKLVTAASTIGKAFGKLATIIGAKGLTGSLTTLGRAFGLVGIAVTAVADGGIRLYQHFREKAIPEIQRFGAEVSASTQEALGAFFSLSDQATIALNQMAWSGQTVTQEMVGNITSLFDQMGDQIIAHMQEDHQKQLETLQGFVLSSKQLTEKEQKEILTAVQKGQEERIKAVQDGQQRINEILNKAKDEKRAITEAERVEILRIQREMVDTAIQVMSENEIEQKAILERMRANASELTALQAAEVVKNSIEQRDRTIEAANQQYNEVIKEIIRLRDEAGLISEEQANKLIQEATRQRDETIKKAQEMHQNVIKEAQIRAREHIDLINWETGEILSKWDVFKNDFSRKWKELTAQAKQDWNQFTTTMKESWNLFTTNLSEKWAGFTKSMRENLTLFKNNFMSEINKITTGTKQDWANFTNFIRQKWSEISVNTRERWNEISLSVRNKVNEIKSYPIQKFEELRVSVGAKFESLRQSIIHPIERARDRILQIINQIKSFFSNLTLKIPSIQLPKLPKFSITGSFSLNPPSVPKISVSWYAKGGIFTKPTIFATPNGLHGVGEKGPELVMPLKGRYMEPYAEAVAKLLNENITKLNSNAGRTVPETNTTHQTVYISPQITFHVRDEFDIRRHEREIVNFVKRSFLEGLRKSGANI